MKNKVISAKEAVEKLVHNGSSVMIGGFGTAGYPELLVDALYFSDKYDLTIIANDAGVVKDGVEDKRARFFDSDHASHFRMAFLGLNNVFGGKYGRGEIDLELIPQGTLAERLRCGGGGLGGVLTPTGVGTIVEEGKQVLEVDGKKYILEKALRGDVAFVKAHKADAYGNLIFKGDSRNFNTGMATAADVVVAEVDEYTGTNFLDPDCIHIPGVMVSYIVAHNLEGKQVE